MLRLVLMMLRPMLHLPLLESHLPAYQETPEPSSILRSILYTYPGLEKAVVNEIMDWVNYKGNPHPM